MKESLGNWKGSRSRWTPTPTERKLLLALAALFVLGLAGQCTMHAAITAGATAAAGPAPSG